MRDSFIFYRSFFEASEDLTHEQRGRIFSAICSYALNGTEQPLSGVMKVLFLCTKKEL